ncbi:hypothetical protein L7F22_033831 [Adiantum nelumboides]|nr:hypothetical protein [Adiantum nelumboides]
MALVFTSMVLARAFVSSSFMASPSPSRISPSRCGRSLVRPLRPSRCHAHLALRLSLSFTQLSPTPFAKFSCLYHLGESDESGVLARVHYLLTLFDVAGCPVGFPRKIQLTGQKEETEEHWYARPKEKEKNRVPFVFPTKLKNHDSFLFVDENRPILEPFTSLSYEELEPRATFKAASCNVFPSPTAILGEGTGAESNWFARLSRGSNRRNTADSSNFLLEQSQVEKSNQRNYAAYLGRHRKILTPRCDPLLVVRMERSNAVVLLQRCLRGRAAQITMADTRSHVLELYPELNQLEESPSEPKGVDGGNDLGAVKALVAKQLFNMFTSMQATPRPTSSTSVTRNG